MLFTEVSLTWRRVSCFKQNGPITGYVVRYYATCGSYRGVQRNKSVVTNSTIIENLSPYTEYAFQVAAVNVNGSGPFSEPIILRGKWFHVLGYSEYNIMLFVLYIIGYPHPPQLVTVIPVNSTTVTVSWSEVQCFNGSGAVTHYLVQYQSMCGGAEQNVTTSGLVKTVSISGLTPNTPYTFQVAAVNLSLNETGLLSEPIILEGTGKRCTHY